MAFKDFTEFFTYLNENNPCYHSKYIYDKICCPKELFHNIDRWVIFNDVIDKLTSSKLFIRHEINFIPRYIFNDYILPVAIFLHYMHVDIDKMNEINLYVVSEKLYDAYNTNLGGEYIDGTNFDTKKKVHIILIKHYNNNTQKNKDKTLKSLFHELMHLVDNLGFKGFKYDIEYIHRWHEIKAYAISAFFVHFYHGIINPSELNNIQNTLWLVKWDLRELSSSIQSEINGNYYCIDDNLDDRYILNTDVDNTHLLKANIQLLTSMQQIYSLLNFFKQIGELLK